jgi:5-methyltetrahydrofolate--homocysteine methyltransferase
MTPPTTNPLLTALDRERPLLLDGAMGTQLLASGFDLRRDFRGHAGSVDVLNLTRAEQVQAVHESYLDAGARVLRSNTFLSSLPYLAERQLAREAQALIRAACQTAREAIEAWCGPDAQGFVLGDIGPPAWRGGSTAGPAAWEQAAADQAASLAAAGVDGILLETAISIEWLAAAVRGAKAGAPRLPCLISAALDATGRLLQSGTLTDLAALAASSGVALVGINCSPGPARAADLLRELSALYPGRLGLWPASEQPREEPAALTPAGFAQAIAPAIELNRLALLGACCGSRPAHIRALAERLGRIGPEADWDQEAGDTDQLE